MKTISTFILILIVLISQHIIGKAFSNEEKKSQQINTYMHDIMQTHQIPGAALAIIKDGKIIHEQYYGKASLEKNTPVTKNTMFRVYSTTKLITATAIFQLIEKEKITLNDFVHDHLTYIPTAWKAIQIKHLLTHSSGLPDMIHYDSHQSDKALLTELAKEKMLFDAGERFTYNQTNYWLLALIIKKVTGISFDDYVLKNQFLSPKSGVLFSSNSNESIPNRIAKYSFDYKKNQFVGATDDYGTRAHSGNGLNITLQELIKWNQNFDNNTFLQKNTKNLMWSDFSFKDQKSKFLHGWGLYPIQNKMSIGFTGGGVSGFRKFVDDDMTIIILTNGFKYYPVHNKIINHIAGIVNPTYIDKESIIKEQVTNGFLNLTTDKAIENYTKISNKNPNTNFERTLNRIGYAMAKSRIEDAIKIFELNVREYPDSWNVYDSLGEGHEMNKNYKASVEFYKKSVERNPENKHGVQKIKELESKLKNVK